MKLEVQPFLRHRLRSAMVAGLFVATAAGCNAGLPAFGDGTAPPAPPTRPPILPTITLAPVITAAPQPAPAASAAPSTAPSSVRTVKFRTFLKHVKASEREFKALGRVWMRQLEQRDVPRALAKLQPLRQWATTEENWLRNNGPLACYARVYDVWQSFVAGGSEAFEILNVALDPIDEREVRRAVAIMHATGAARDAYFNSPGFKSGADFDC
jgi:hypothetical protein